MEDIRIWFNGKRNYQEGVKLYLQHGNDATLKRLFTAEGYSDFKNKRLIAALEELLAGRKKPGLVAISKTRKKDSPIVEMVIGNISSQIHSEPPIEKRWPAERDDVLQSLWLKWKVAFGEMMNLSARLHDVAKAGDTDPNKRQEAGRMALRILDLDDECDRIYDTRDYYRKNKKLPIEAMPIEISLDPALWGKRLENHKRYVRKFKLDLKKDPTNTDKAELLQNHEWAVNKYMELLKMI